MLCAVYVGIQIANILTEAGVESAVLQFGSVIRFPVVVIDVSKRVWQAFDICLQHCCRTIFPDFMMDKKSSEKI